jgi:hypothetical protein
MIADIVVRWPMILLILMVGVLLLFGTLTAIAAMIESGSRRLAQEAEAVQDVTPDPVKPKTVMTPPEVVVQPRWSRSRIATVTGGFLLGLYSVIEYAAGHPVQVVELCKAVTVVVTFFYAALSSKPGTLTSAQK